MTNKQAKQAELYANSALGIYIPQYFAETVKRDQILYVTEEDWKILEAGPDGPECEFYLETWDTVLNCAETRDGGVLWQDGDLWIVYAQDAIDLVNDTCESMLEYETRHGDAGDAYGHLPAESWTDTDTTNLLESLNEEKRDHSVKDHFAPDSYKPHWQILGIDPRWQSIDPDTLADIALESFEMQAGSIYGPFDGGITLASYAVQEIEIDLSHLGIGGVTLDFIRESCDAYISGDDLAYVTTDSVWYAVLDVEWFNINIEQWFERNS